MKTKGQFTLFTVAEFAQWLNSSSFGRKVTHVQNHHTAVPSYGNFNGKNHFALLEGMKKYHVQHNGWADIGQHLTTFPDGTVAVCRSFEKTPACILGANSGGVCIESVGNFDVDAMTAEQRTCIVQVNALLCKRFKLPVSTTAIVYHHWFDLDTGKRHNGAGKSKSCPGAGFFGGNKVPDCEAHFLPTVKAALAALSGSPAAAEKSTIGVARVSVGNDTLSIRIAPATAAATAGTLPDGLVVQIYEAKGIWRRIDPARQYWVSSKFLQTV